MNEMKPQQCKETNIETFSKIITCCICKLYQLRVLQNGCSIPQISNKSKNIYNLTPYNTCPISRMKLGSNYQYCLVNTMSRISDQIRINNYFEKIIMNEEISRNLETNQKEIKVQFYQVSDKIKKINSKNNISQKKKLELVQKVKVKIGFVELIRLNNFNKMREKIEEKNNLIIKSNDRTLLEIKILELNESKSGGEKELKYSFNLKNSDLDLPYNKLNKILKKFLLGLKKPHDDLIKMLKDKGDKKNKSLSKTQFGGTKFKNFINREKEFDYKMTFIRGNMRKEIKSEFNTSKSHDIFISLSKFNKLKSIKLNNSKKYNLSIEFDTFNDDALKIGKLKSNHEFHNVLNKFEKLDNIIDIEIYFNNKIISKNEIIVNISYIIKNSHESLVYDGIIIIKDNLLISCSCDNLFYNWNFKNISILNEIKNAYYWGKNNSELLFHNYENINASVEYYSNISFCDTNYNQIDCTDNFFNVQLLIQSSNIIIEGVADKFNNFYDINSNLFINTITTDHKCDHNDSIWKLLLLKSTDIFLTRSYDSIIKIWNIMNHSIRSSLKDNKCKFTITGLKERIKSLFQFKYDNNLKVSSDEDGTNKLCCSIRDNKANYKLINKFKMLYFNNNANQRSYKIATHELFENKIKTHSFLFCNLEEYKIIINSLLKYLLKNLRDLENYEEIVLKGI